MEPFSQGANLNCPSRSAESPASESCEISSSHVAEHLITRHGNGIPPRVKYMMVATVALPKLEREKGDQKDPEVEMDEAPEGDLFSRQAEAGEDEVEENQGGDHKAAEELNQKWLEHAKRLAEPVGVQPAELSAPCNMEIKLSQRLREEHWGWKNQLMEELRSVAVGEDEGGLHGYTLEFLESQITTLEDELVELDRSENVARLKSLVANSQQGGQDQPDGPPATVLQTYTVPLQQVRKELDLWKQPLLAEYKSLLDTGAIQVTNEEEVKRHPNYANLERAPAMLVPTIKAPSGRRKARIVICGNRIEKADGGQQSVEVEKSSPFSTHAGGADGTLLRCLTRKAAAEDWTVASLDVATAFLLAPRRAASQCLLIMKPPRILIEAGICDEGDLWRIENALYGLQSSPADWSSYRNNVLGKLRWMFGTEEFHLVRTSEQNLWKILPTKEPINKEDVAQGYVALYVDDVMAVGNQGLVDSFLAKIQEVWKCSKPEYVSTVLG